MNLFKVGMKKWNFKSFFAINLVILLFVLVLLSIPPTEGEVIEEVINLGDNYPLVEVGSLLVEDASNFDVIEQTYHSLSNETSKIAGIDINSTQIYIRHFDEGIFFGGNIDDQSTLSTFSVEVNYLNPLLWEMFFEGFDVGIMPPIAHDYENFIDLEILNINLESEDRNITFDGQSIKLFVTPIFSGIIPNRGTSNAFKIFLPMKSLAPFGDQANIEYWMYYFGLFSNLSNFQNMTKISQIEDYSKQISDVVVSIIQKYDEFKRIDILEYRLLNLINSRYGQILEDFRYQILELIPFIIGFEFLLLIIVNKSYLQ